LAHTNPDLRPHLLPILKEAAVLNWTITGRMVANFVVNSVKEVSVGGFASQEGVRDRWYLKGFVTFSFDLAGTSVTFPASTRNKEGIAWEGQIRRLTHWDGKEEDEVDLFTPVEPKFNKIIFTVLQKNLPALQAVLPQPDKVAVLLRDVEKYHKALALIIKKLTSNRDAQFQIALTVMTGTGQDIPAVLQKLGISADNKTIGSLRRIQTNWK